jgi:tetratricopeptide (TPR) repeat protein
MAKGRLEASAAPSPQLLVVGVAEIRERFEERAVVRDAVRRHGAVRDQAELLVDHVVLELAPVEEAVWARRVEREDVRKQDVGERVGAGLAVSELFECLDDVTAEVLLIVHGVAGVEEVLSVAVEEDSVDRRPAHPVDLISTGIRRRPDADIRVSRVRRQHAARQLEDDRGDVPASEEVRSDPTGAERESVSERREVEEERIVAAPGERLDVAGCDDVRLCTERCREALVHRDQELAVPPHLELLGAVVGRLAETNTEVDVRRRVAVAGGPPALITQGEASLANTRHRFKDGLRLAREAIGLDHENGAAYGALGDALLNLGRYRQAFQVYDEMALKAPGIASFTRVGSARELVGRPKAAVAADELALEADATIPEQIAWTMTQIGNIRFNMGRLGAAATAYRRALRRFPGYVHAEAGLARVEAAEGHDREAIARLSRAVVKLPVPAYVIWLGDILHVSGREAAARREYALVRAIEKLYAANGVRTELQTAVFDLDHDRNVADALARARAAYESAPGIYAEDALSWGLFRVGRCGAARAHSVRALRLGTRDGLLAFHRAMIERCLGSPSARWWFRQSLAINPHFSFLWASVARRELR